MCPGVKLNYLIENFYFLVLYFEVSSIPILECQVSNKYARGKNSSGNINVYHWLLGSFWKYKFSNMLKPFLTIVGPTVTFGL